MTLPQELPLDRLLAQRRYLHALASELVFDAHLAQDVEQQVLLAALEHPPRDQALRGWLAALVRNFAIKAWRSSARRALREQLAARPEGVVPSPAEILAREDQYKRLVELVLGLEEPLRSVILLRFFEDLPPREVARRLHVPVETARTRIKRGLEVMRERLDRKERGDRTAWAAAMVRALRVPASRVQLASTSVSFIRGILLMSLARKTTMAVIAVASLVASGWYLRERLVRDQPLERASPVPELAAPDRQPSALAPTELPSGASREPVRGPAAVAGTTAEGSVLLRVNWHDGTPAAGIGAMLRTASEEFDVVGSRQDVTGPEGICLFEHLAPGWVRVLLDRDVSEELEVRAGEQVERPLTIPRGNDVEGIVVESDGTPVAAAEVCVDSWLDFVLARSGADGRFSIRSVSERTSYLYARAPLHAPTVQWCLGGGSGHTYEVRLVFPAKGGALQGTVRDWEGKPVSEAWVQVGDYMGYFQGELSLPDGSKEGRLTAVQLVRTDAEGHFRVAGAPTGTQPVKVRACGFGPWKGEVEIFDASPTYLDVTLREGTSVAGTVTDAAGQPVAGVEIVNAHDQGLLQRVTRSSADGTYLLEDLPDWEFQLRAMHWGWVADSVKVKGAPGLALRWDPRIDGGLTIRGRVVVPGIEGARFMVFSHAVAADGTPTGDNLTTDEHGRFELVRCQDLPYEIEVGSAMQPMYPVAVVEGVRPGPDEVVIEIDPARMPSVRLKGRVLDSQGEPLAFTWVSPYGQGTTGLLFSTRADGTFDLGQFPPGRWGITVMKERSPHALLHTDTVEVAANEIFDFGDLRAGE